jgi:hypothetical protein
VSDIAQGLPDGYVYRTSVPAETTASELSVWFRQVVFIDIPAAHIVVNHLDNTAMISVPKSTVRELLNWAINNQLFKELPIALEHLKRVKQVSTSIKVYYDPATEKRGDVTKRLKAAGFRCALDQQETISAPPVPRFTLGDVIGEALWPPPGVNPIE